MIEFFFNFNDLKRVIIPIKQNIEIINSLIIIIFKNKNAITNLFIN